MTPSISPYFLFLFLILTLIHIAYPTGDPKSNVMNSGHVREYNSSLYVSGRRVGARGKNKMGGSGGWSYSWGWGGGGGGGGGGGKNGSGWGWGWGGGGGGGGKGWWRWGCDGGHHKHGSHLRQDGKRVSGLQDEYRVGEYAKCVVKGKCHGLRLVCPLHCGGACAYDCRNMCKAHCIR